MTGEILAIISGVIGILAVLIPWWISKAREKKKAREEAERRREKDHSDQLKNRKERQKDTRRVNESIDRQRDSARKWRNELQGPETRD